MQPFTQSFTHYMETIVKERIVNPGFRSRNKRYLCVKQNNQRF